MILSRSDVDSLLNSCTTFITKEYCLCVKNSDSEKNKKNIDRE